jgi:branched-chain amino acid transport system permease protein
MIVTMMFAQVLYLTTLYLSPWTMGDQGFVLPQPDRAMDLFGMLLDFSDPATRYWTALALFAAALAATLGLVRSRHGHVLSAIRENEERTRMLGYDTYANKLMAVVASGTISAAAGAFYAVLFGYVGSSFASIQYSILPLLWVLTGGAATTLGPLIGTLFMYYAVDIASGYSSAWLLLVGLALIMLVLFFPRGILGSIRERWLGWLP